MMMRYFLPAVLVVLVVVTAALLYSRQTGVETQKIMASINSIPSMKENKMKHRDDADVVYVKVFNKDGVLTGPVSQEKVIKSEEEWKKELDPETYRISREAGTERAFTGKLLKNSEKGVYTCAACELPLFRSETKFDSGTGWPSFYEPIADENVVDEVDASLGMARTENLCARCHSHLGHVFNDGPKPTGLRYCMNSGALGFVPDGEIVERLGTETSTESDLKDLVLAGGCFWCVEAVFEEVAGVINVVSGYAGGDADTAEYKLVASGRTKHAEAVRVRYDGGKVSLEDLLKIHFATHDPTTLNRQGNDVGPQYRSAIFYANEEEKKIAEAFIADLENAGVFNDSIKTTLEPLDEFYEAEAYHQNYVCRNPMNPYVKAIALPKVEKVRKVLGVTE